MSFRNNALSCNSLSVLCCLKKKSLVPIYSYEVARILHSLENIFSVSHRCASPCHIHALQAADMRWWLPIQRNLQFSSESQKANFQTIASCRGRSYHSLLLLTRSYVVFRFPVGFSPQATHAGHYVVLFFRLISVEQAFKKRLRPSSSALIEGITYSFYSS